MADMCFTQFKLPMVRATLLDVCGIPVDSTCSTVATSGVVSIEETGEYKDREEFFPENGNGDFCMEETVAPILKWLNLVITFCGVDPQLVNIITANPVILDNDDTTVPNQIGFGVDQGSTQNSNFALEGWTRLGGSSNCNDGVLQYGYVLYPWLKEATIGDVTYANDTANFVVNARAARFSGWGTGPYNVVRSEATATLGVPQALFSAIPATRFKQVIVTKQPPPVSACGCVDLTPPLTFADSGVLTGMATLPTRNGTAIVPGYITWGDATPAQLVTAGPTVSHTYGAPGTYTVTYKPLAESSASYVSAPTAIA
jgi:hypothetical protein